MGVVGSIVAILEAEMEMLEASNNGGDLTPEKKPLNAGAAPRPNNASDGVRTNDSEPIASRTRSRAGINQPRMRYSPYQRTRRGHLRGTSQRTIVRNNSRSTRRSWIVQGNQGGTSIRIRRHVVLPRQPEQNLMDAHLENLPYFWFFHDDENLNSNSAPIAEPLDLSIPESAEVSDPFSAFKCSICLEEYVRKRPVSTICGHIYCYQCIIHWLRISNNCPKCNKIADPTQLVRVFP